VTTSSSSAHIGKVVFDDMEFYYLCSCGYREPLSWEPNVDEIVRIEQQHGFDKSVEAGDS
jgi:hypothetical protein